MRRSVFAIGAGFAALMWGGLNSGCDDDEECGEGQDLYLTGGQTLPVGGMHAENDGDTLSVSYSTTDGWLLDEVHLHVACARAEIPATGSGNPIPGQFDHAETFSPGVTSHTFEVPLSSLSCDPGCGQEIVLAAHAAVSNPGNGASETAWGSSFDPNDPAADPTPWEFGGSRWGWFAPFVVECCEDEDTDDGDPEGGATDGGGEETVIDPPDDSGGGGEETPLDFTGDTGFWGGDETVILEWDSGP